MLRCPLSASPLYGFIQDIAVGGVFGRKGVAAVLDTEHYEGFGAVVAHGAFSGRRHAHDRAFFDGERVAVDLKFTFSGKEKVELLVVFVGVEEAGFLSGCENLERKFRSGGSDSRASEYFAGNFDFGTEFENVVFDVGKFTEIGGAEIGGRLNCLNLFHESGLCGSDCCTAAKLLCKFPCVNKLLLYPIVTFLSLLQIFRRIDNSFFLKKLRCLYVREFISNFAK